MQYQNEISAFVHAHREEYLADLRELIAIPSVSEELVGATEEMPFGCYSAEALDKMLALCRRYGLATRTIGRVIGIAEFGTGERELDIVAHLDVQPAGAGWETEPFALTLRGNIAYGRGVSDDKGPALAALYAVRALRELGLTLGKKVRLVFGTGEEYAIQDIHYYTDVESAPPFMFTPDHTFPVVNTHKACYTCTFSKTLAERAAGGVLSLVSGDNRGAVPAESTMLLRGVEMAALNAAVDRVSARTGLSFSIVPRGEAIEVGCVGVSTHAVKADHGKSALTAMLALAAELPLPDTEGSRALCRLAELFPHGDVAGRACGLYREDEASGGSLYNIGIFRYDGQTLFAQQRATLPASCTEEEFPAFFRGALEKEGFSVTDDSFSAGRHIPLTDPYVEKLLRSYECHTGEKAFGIAAGGGCYADYFPHGVAFGCEPYGVDTRMHGAQEWVSVEHMMKTVCVYAQSILAICG